MLSKLQLNCSVLLLYLFNFFFCCRMINHNRKRVKRKEGRRQLPQICLSNIPYRTPGPSGSSKLKAIAVGKIVKLRLLASTQLRISGRKFSIIFGLCLYKLTLSLFLNLKYTSVFIVQQTSR